MQTVTDNDFRFTQTGNAFTVRNNSASQIRIQLLSITGQVVAPVITIHDAIFNYQNINLAAGIYLVNVISDNGVATFKWVNQGR